MLSPRDEQDLSEIVAGRRDPLAIRGGGTRGISVEGDVLTTASMDRITLYEPGALTIVAQAGTPVSAIESALAENNQMLAFEPSDYRAFLGTKGEPTIGGVVAANVSGPRRVTAGACRDFLLGVRFVDGAGTITKNGGRVMKNVTGYDLVKLMAGSLGTLGVLTEVSFKVLPRPEAQATLRVGVADARAAVTAMSEALTTPFDVTGAFYDAIDGAHTVQVRVEGRQDSVAYRAGRLCEVLSGYGEPVVIDDPTASTDIWRAIRHMDVMRDGKVILRSAVKPSDAPDLLAIDGDSTHYLDWGGGRVWHVMQAESAASRIEMIREHLSRVGGHATVVKAPPEVLSQVPRFQPEPPVLQRLAGELRRKFDPNGILNVGVMG